MDRKLEWYSRLPYPGKVAAATAQGARLAMWRYGPASEPLVEAALDRDRWDAEQWQEWQEARRSALLRHAVTQVPFYREWFARHPERDPTVLKEWPVVAKSTVRAGPRQFVAADAPRRLYVDQTSGTSGSPLSVYASRSVLRSSFALLEARNRRWHGVSRHDRWAILGGQMIARAGRSRPPYWVWNPALHQLYLSSHNVSARTVRDYVAVLDRHRPTHLVVYPSVAAYLARLGLDAGLAAHGPRVVITNAEPVSATQRFLIEAFFGCPVRETYGMAEMVAGASECGAGRLHQWPDAGMVEVLDDTDEPMAAGEPGRLVLTGFVNDTMPLIRYDVGDRGGAPRATDSCPCGRLLPTQAPVEGRSQDMVAAHGGRQFWINPVFYGLPVAEAQIIQERIDQIRVLVVPMRGFDATVAGTIAARLRLRLGDVCVEVEERREIERGPNGKFRPVVSLLSDD